MQSQRENDQSLAPVSKLPLSAIFLVLPGENATLPQTLKRWADLLSKRFSDFEMIGVRVDPKATCKPEESIPGPPEGSGYAIRWIPGVYSGPGSALRKAFEICQHGLLFYTTGHPGMVQEKTFDRLRKTMDKAHLAGLCRVMRNYSFWMRMVHLGAGLFKRVLLSFPMGKILGPQRLRERFPAWVADWVFGLKFHDPLLPFRFLRREILSNIPIQSEGNFCHLEIPAKANFAGLFLAEEEWQADDRELTRFNCQPDPWFFGDFSLVARKPSFRTDNPLPIEPGLGK
ncbi:MAG: hypothetical protein EXR99_12225 [Gemmataceae bacterium]|nr:hypothetical protein [Gemmataceae bacterium]